MTSFEDCARAICEEFSVTPLDLISDRRAREVSYPRMALCWLARKSTTHSLPWIGNQLHKDHTTVIRAVRRVEQIRANNAAFRARTDTLMIKLSPDVDFGGWTT